MEEWFTVEKIDRDTYAISEYKHWEEPHCYLLCGQKESLLIDTGLGICNIAAAVKNLTACPVVAVPTHIHWDHIGGLQYFSVFYSHRAELQWLQGEFPLPLDTVRAILADRCKLPDGFDINRYTIFQGKPGKLLEDGDEIDLGGRKISVLHTPGHSPGHMCFWENDRGYLFTGDLVYRGMLYCNYPSTDPAAYLHSLNKISALPVKRIFPGHHSLEIGTDMISKMREAFVDLQVYGKLRHGSGKYLFEDWSVWL